MRSRRKRNAGPTNGVMSTPIRLLAVDYQTTDYKSHRQIQRASAVGDRTKLQTRGESMSKTPTTFGAAMNHVNGTLIAIALLMLPCLLISQSSQAQTSRKCSALRTDERELQYASAALAKCASVYDPSDSCDTEFNDVRDAHDALEDAVSDANDDCE